MPLAAGTRLGHYTVSALIGEGGMGQVWQATDTQLNQQVALKILPDAFAADSDRLARFTPEAAHEAGVIHRDLAREHRGIAAHAGALRPIVCSCSFGRKSPVLCDPRENHATYFSVP
jgi:hypothetical protein